MNKSFEYPNLSKTEESIERNNKRQKRASKSNRKIMKEIRQERSLARKLYGDNHD